ncbi:putative ribonuclease H-like domain-containing protein, partial [Tanacetum coccineum]
ETSGILKTFITKIENQLDHKVKVIRSDNGTEFKNSVMNQFYEIKGIKREFSVFRTPQQNGVAERRNKTLIEDARTMYVVPTGRVKVLAGRYVVPTGKDNVIVSTGRTSYSCWWLICENPNFQFGSYLILRYRGSWVHCANRVAIPDLLLKWCEYLLLSLSVQLTQFLWILGVCLAIDLDLGVLVESRSLKDSYFDWFFRSGKSSASSSK